MSVEFYMKQCDVMRKDIIELRQLILAKDQAIARAVDALEFYAKEPKCKRAEEALAKIKELRGEKNGNG